MHIVNMTIQKWMFNYERVKKEFWQLVGGIGVILFLVIIIPSSDTDDTGTEEVTAFDRAVSEYQTMTGRKIYPSGRAALLKAAQEQGLTTEAEVLKLIHENEKFMFK